jgi:hypothetical protein
MTAILKRRRIPSGAVQIAVESKTADYAFGSNPPYELRRDKPLLGRFFRMRQYWSLMVPGGGTYLILYAIANAHQFTRTKITYPNSYPCARGLQWCTIAL